MKRKHIDDIKVYKIFPLSWKQCCMCGNDFKFEFGWRFMSGPYYRGRGVNYYICNNCANNKNKTIEIISNQLYISRPKAPPPPPPPKPIFKE